MDRDSQFHSSNLKRVPSVLFCGGLTAVSELQPPGWELAMQPLRASCGQGHSAAVSLVKWAECKRFLGNASGG